MVIFYAIIQQMLTKQFLQQERFSRASDARDNLDKSITFGTDKLINISCSVYYHIVRDFVTCDSFAKTKVMFLFGM